MSAARLVVAADAAGMRLDVFLAEHLPEMSRSQVKRLVSEGAVRVDGETAAKASRTLPQGARVEVRVRHRTPTSGLEPEAIPLRVLYEDDEIAVIDKPAGLVVHPAPGNETGTLVHALLHRFGDRLSATSDAARPGIVHRLDKGTTGVIAVALTDSAHQHLARQFAERTVAKTYVALVYGCPRQDSGRVDVAIGRDRNDRKKISANTNVPREAQTDWRIVERFEGLTLVELRPRTGRTHQIRAHMAWLHHPLVGDELYVGRQWKGIKDTIVRAAAAGFGRPALHAVELELEHPTRGARMRFQAPTAVDFEALIELLRQRRDGAPAAG